MIRGFQKKKKISKCAHEFLLIENKLSEKKIPLVFLKNFLPKSEKIGKNPLTPPYFFHHFLFFSSLNSGIHERFIVLYYFFYFLLSSNLFFSLLSLKILGAQRKSMVEKLYKPMRITLFSSNCNSKNVKQKFL